MADAATHVPRKRGRPKGSKNKPKVLPNGTAAPLRQNRPPATQAAAADAPRKRGRPKGSKNQPKTSLSGAAALAAANLFFTRPALKDAPPRAAHDNDDEDDDAPDDNLADGLDPHDAADNDADDFFAAERSAKTAVDRRTLSSVGGVTPGELRESVHKLVLEAAAATAHPDDCARYRSLYPEWLSLLHTGFSVLLHGFGSKKGLLDDFVTGLPANSAVVTLHGYAASSSVRELLISILQGLGLAAPKASNALLISLLRRTFAAAEAKADAAHSGSSLVPADIRALAARPGPHAAGGVLKAVLKLLPGQAALDEPGSEVAASPSAAAKAPATPTADKATSAAAASVAEPRTSVAPRRRPNAATSTPAAATSPRKRGRPSKQEAASMPPPKRKMCGTPGCTQHDHHFGPCDRDIAQLSQKFSSNESVSLIARRTRTVSGSTSGAVEAKLAREAPGRRGVSSSTNSDVALAAARAPTHLYVVVHSIDGEALRHEKHQHALAALAAIPQVHLVASCSHRNTALLWEGQHARAFNWAWQTAHTGAVSAAEARDGIHRLMDKLLDSVDTTEGHSARVVLDALTPNARKVFRQLVRHQLDQPASAGLTFRELYDRCKAKMCASSEAALKAHLREFQDHQLVRARRGGGGGDKQCFYCTLGKDMMAQVAKESE